MNLIIYIPALNEEDTISNVISSIPKTIDKINNINILVVDDGSTDNTCKISQKLGATVISHSNNKGVGIAFQTAVQYCIDNNVDIMVSIDADGQFETTEIPTLIAPILNQKSDFVTGTRFDNGKPKNMSNVKFWGNKKVNQIISYISKININDASCGFRAYNRESLLNLNLKGKYTYTHESILELTFKGLVLGQVPIKVKYFDDRVSRVANNIFKYFIKTSSIIIRCFKDYKPLPIFISFSLMFLILGIGFVGFTIIHWMNFNQITPYKSIGIAGLFSLSFSLFIFLFALISDTLGNVRREQEKIIYMLKKNKQC